MYMNTMWGKSDKVLLQFKENMRKFIEKKKLNLSSKSYMVANARRGDTRLWYVADVCVHEGKEALNQ